MIANELIEADYSPNVGHCPPKRLGIILG